MSSTLFFLLLSCGSNPEFRKADEIRVVRELDQANPVPRGPIEEGQDILCRRVCTHLATLYPEAHADPSGCMETCATRYSERKADCILASKSRRDISRCLH